MGSKLYFKKICKNLNSYEFTEEFKKNKKQIENDLDRLEKYDTLYNTIKQKRDNAKNAYTHYIVDRHELVESKGYDETIQEQKELSGQLKAYNDVLSLIESMFEVKENA